VFGVEWERVSEEEVRPFFDGDSSEGIEPAFVSLLELLGESLVGLECSVSHFANNSKW
jgi:hypothetical protein